MVLKPGVFDDSIASALKKLSDMRDTLSVAPQATAKFDSDVDLAGDLRTALVSAAGSIQGYYCRRIWTKRSSAARSTPSRPT